MQKNCINTTIIIAIVLVLTVAILSAVFATSHIVVSGSIGEGDLNAVIIDEGMTKLQQSQSSQLNIFTLNGLDENYIIMPSSSGEYSFAVKNTARFPLKYTMSLSDTNAYKIPMVFRLRDSAGIFLLGSENEWVSVETPQNLYGSIPYGEQDTFLLEWRWNGSSDEADTAIGIQACEDVYYTFNVDVFAKQSGPFAISGLHLENMDMLSFWLAIILTGVFVGLSYFVMRNRKDTHRK